MYNSQEQEGRDYDHQMGLGQNYIHDNNLMAEGEEIGQTDPQQYATNDYPPQTESDHSFHMDKCIEKIYENPRFSEKEREFSQKVDNFIKSKSGKSISTFSGYMFLVNKILLLCTFTEFLFQRFDVITLFLSLVIILIELGVFSHKHIYKWIIVLLASLLLDALVLLDISPVSLYIFNVFRLEDNI